MNKNKIMELENITFNIMQELNDFYKVFEKGTKSEMELGLAYLDTLKCRVNGMIRLCDTDYRYAPTEELTL